MSLPPGNVLHATLHPLAFAERNVAHRAGREQLLDLEAAVAQAVLVGVLQQRLDGRPVLLDAVRKPVRPDDRLLLLDQRLQPGERGLRRAEIGELVVGVFLGLAERLVERERHPGIAIVDVAADHDRMHDRIDLGAAVIVLLHLARSSETAAAPSASRAGTTADCWRSS